MIGVKHTHTVAATASFSFELTGVYLMNFSLVSHLSCLQPCSLSLNQRSTRENVQRRSIDNQPSSRGKTPNLLLIAR